MNDSGLTTLLLEHTPRLADSSSEGSGDSQGSLASVYTENDVNYMLWLTVPPLLLLLGSFGNVMTIVVMRGMRTSDSTACLSVYFTALAVSDLLLLLTTVIWYWPEMAFDTPVSYFHDLSCTVPNFICYFSTMTSAWLLMALTGQRLMSVLLPHRVGLLCTVRRGKIVTALIVVSGLVINVHILFTYHVQNVDDDYDACVSVDERSGLTHMLVDLFLSSVVPFLFLLLANSVLISHTMQSIRRSRHMAVQHHHQAAARSAQISSMTVTLIMTSVAFMALSLPTCVLDLYLESVGFYDGQVKDEGLNKLLTLLDTVCPLLWISNSAVNFYIYILSGRKFREETRRRLCSRFKAESTSQGQARKTIT